MDNNESGYLDQKMFCKKRFCKTNEKCFKDIKPADERVIIT